MEKLVTRESLIQMLQKPDAKYVNTVVGRALVAIYERQTFDEKSSSNTLHHNSIGFTAIDAQFGTSCAKFYSRNGYLSYNQVKYWTKLNSKGIPKISKYWKQLNEIANQKKLKKVA